MRSTRTIIVVVLLTCSLSSGQPNKGTKKVPDQNIHHTPVPASANSEPAKSNDQNRNDDVHLVSVPEKIPVEPIRDRLDYVVLGCTVILSVAGIIGVPIAVKTLRTINRHSAHLQDLAEAALLNAQAAINAERPWLVVTWRSDTNIEGLFRFGCRNSGSTPAKVISLSAKAMFVENLDRMATPPDYSSPGILPDLHLIVRTDSFPISPGLNAHSFIESQGKADLVAESREFLVYYGNVVYRDTLYPDSAKDGLHETRWCFVYQPHQKKKFVRSGPSEYNQYS
jgi:hypothetical protein